MPDFDLPAAHRYFSAQCFNQTWDLLDKSVRTPDEDEQMLRLSLASHYHWTQRPDYSPQNASIAYWLTARVCAVLGDSANARHHAQLSLEQSQKEGVGPFFKAYALEALARAEALAGHRAMADEYIVQARRLASQVPDPEDQQRLLDDLGTI